MELVLRLLPFALSSEPHACSREGIWIETGGPGVSDIFGWSGKTKQGEQPKGNYN